MFLSLLAEVDLDQVEKTTDLVQLISIIAMAVLLIAVVVICFANRKMNTRSIVYAAICIAASFALSFIKINPVPNGGSITLASFVPLLIYAYAFGPVRGLIVGLIYGVLQFIQGPYLLTPVTFMLDYLLAFASIALMGFAKHFSKKTLVNVLLGTGLVYLARFIMHLCSGVIYFNLNCIWVDLPTPNAFVYSLIYQCVYIPADCAITMIVLTVLVSQKVFSRLVDMMKLAKGAKITEIKVADSAPVEGQASETPAPASEASEKTSQESENGKNSEKE